MQIATRSSPTAKNNPRLVEIKEFAGDNLAFVAEALRQLDLGRTTRRHLCFGLVGSRDLMGNTLRRAQAVLRRDLRPSLWSHAFAFVAPPSATAKEVAALKVRGVPLDTRSRRLPEPAWNGVTEGSLDLYNDPRRDANFAVISIELNDEQAERTVDRFYSPNADRVRFDLWNSLCAWQRYYWSFGSDPNPLQQGVPIPASHFIEHCYDALQIDLTPGTSERASAPELLWSTVKYWHESFASRGHSISGAYVVRDPGCTILGPDFTTELSSASASPARRKRLPRNSN